MRKMKKAGLLLLFTLSFLLGGNLYGQEEITPEATKANALNVFMDADDFIKREITFVNYVRDQRDAQLNIIRTVQPTGAGGREYTFFLEGLKEFKGVNDTLKLITQPNETTDAIRTGIVKTLKTGLIRYVSKTPLIEYFQILYNEPVEMLEPDDAWNNWVFRAEIYGSLSGEKLRSSFSYYGSVSANRITEASKTEIGFSFHRNRSRFSFENEDIEDFIDTTHSFDANLSHVVSLGERFSAGGFGGFSSSSFSNFKTRFSLTPAVEYNLFPYSQSTRRQLRFQYRVGCEFNNYMDTTMYEKTQEVLFSQRFSLAFSMVESWGSISLSGSYQNYLHDFSKRNLFFYGSFNLRVVKGLSVSFRGEISFINFQPSLRKGDLTLEQMLLERTELATDYRIYTSIGLSYTFGSIFSNVVNPRFGSSYY